MRNIRIGTRHASHSRFFLTVLFTVLVFAAPLVGTAQTVTVFEGATLIAGDGSAAIENAAIVVQNDRITAIGRSGQVTVPAGATRVDLKGKTVMPTIIDAHKHLAGERDKLIQQLKTLASYGVGAVLSLGQDVSDDPFKVRGEIIDGAARYFTAGRGITTPEPGRSEVAYWITSVEGGRQAVREQAMRKVDIIKIWVDDRNGQYKKMSPEQYTAIIDEAHKHNTRVAAHIYAMDDAKGLLRAGLDAFAHGIRDKDIDDETVALFKQHPNVVLIPNLPERGVAADMSWLRGWIPDEELTKVQAAAVDDSEAHEFWGIQARNLLKLHKAGVKISFGTDGGVLWEHHLQLEDMVASGMTPAEVITAATKTSAEFLKLTDTGVLAQGKSADFIVLDANPLQDIRNTRKINAVYLRGKKVDRMP